MALDKLLLEDSSGGYELEDGSGRILLDPLGPSISAALSITEGADTASIAATAAIAASVSKTEASDTQTIAGTVAVAATVSKTEAADTLSASATIAIAAVVSVTEADDSARSAATASTDHGAQEWVWHQPWRPRAPLSKPQPLEMPEVLPERY